MSDARQIARLRKATGLGWLNARLFLAGQSPALCERIISAKETQSGRLLHDPIEDDPSLADAFADAKARAEEAVSNHLLEPNEKFKREGLNHSVRRRPLGSCHLIWREMKRELWEKHQIEWFSPREMNPGIRFD